MGLLVIGRTAFLLASGFLLLMISGCGIETAGVAPGNPAATAYSPAKTCSASSTVTLDYGQQIGVAATSRGVWTDVRYIPSGVAAGTGAANGNVIQYTSGIGVAYVDTGALALKYSYWSNGSFKTEVVFGDSAADITYVELGYLSNSPNTGIPLIFFTNGAVNGGQIMMAVRSSASLTAPATWAVQAIDSAGGSPNRALEVSISPKDQVALAYQGVTLPTANNIRFISCSANCQLPSNYLTQPSSAAGRIDAGAVATQTHIGLRWCQMSSQIYNPVVVYGASATTYQLAICNTGGTNTLTSCQTNAGWTKTAATMAATGASGTVSEMYIDPAIIGDTPKMIIKDVGAAQMKTFSTAVACNAIVGGSTYTAAGTSALVGSGIANFANSSLRLLKAADYATPANERFFLVANDGTTAVKWSGSTTNSFNGAWYLNAATAIQTVTLNAAGSTSLGADLNLTTKQLIAGYGTAAGSFNVNLGVVNDFTNPGDPGSPLQSYFQLPVEGSGHQQLNAAQIVNIAISSTSTSRPAVAWIDFSSGVSTTGRLKYAVRNGSSSTNPWTTYLVPGVTGVPAPQNPSLAFDENDRPWIGYWDAQAAGAGRFILTTNSAPDGSGAWTNYQFPVIAAGHGAPVAQPAANMVAVAMSVVSGARRPTLIVLDNGTTPAVKSSSLNPATGAWSAVTVIESLSVQGASFLSADWSPSSNLVVVAYQNLATGTTRVKYSASTDSGLTWPVNTSTALAVSSVAQGEGATIKLNPQTNLPTISYYDRANAKMYVAPCVSSCTGTGVPVFTGTTTPIASGIGISGLSAAGNYNLLSAALTFSGAGDTYVLYNSGQLDTGALRMIDSSLGPLASSAISTVIGGTNGAFANASATNGGIPWGQRSYRLPNGVLAMAYQSAGNALAVTTCGD
jgi:hypothetical protein